MINRKHCRGCDRNDADHDCVELPVAELCESVCVQSGTLPGKSVNHQLRPRCFTVDGYDFIPVSLIARRARNAAGGNVGPAK